MGHQDLVPDSSDPPDESLDQLFAFAYHELRTIAHRRLGGSGEGQSLSTTALVNEAYLKLVDQSRGEWRNRAHFFAVASLAMRHVLVDCAKARGTLKRGGERTHITLDEESIAVDDQPDALLELDEALRRLAMIEPRLARVVECRFFGGMPEAEIADALDVTIRTVRRDWVKARVILQRMLEEDAGRSS